VVKKLFAGIAAFLEGVKILKDLLAGRDEDQPVFNGSKISSGYLDD
jgi:hypothetical protein